MKNKSFFLMLSALMLGLTLQAQFVEVSPTRLATGDTLLIGPNPLAEGVVNIHGQTTIRRDGGNAAPLLGLTGTGSEWTHFHQIVNNQNNMFTDWSMVPPSNSSNATLRFFRYTNTEGTKQVDFLRGRNTPAVSARIGVDGANSFFQAHGGFVGIGHSNPASELDVRGLFRLRSTNNHTYGMRVVTNGDLEFVRDGGIVIMRMHDEQGLIRIGTPENAANLRIEGRGIMRELQILGGADISEFFKVSPKAAAPEAMPGMLVSIDPENPGELRVTTSAYDHKVAGIISGANGITTGLTLSQEGTIAHGDYPVALSGRVYVYADANQTPIEAGDLLTSSEVPGHVMKATERDKAHGAIVGKAMTSLSEGRGFVLVLVSLQ